MVYGESERDFHCLLESGDLQARMPYSSKTAVAGLQPAG